MKEIGSNFWLDSDSLKALQNGSLNDPELFDKGYSYLSTCRSAIGIALDSICVKRKVALLPAFTCESVVTPFLIRGFAVFPFSVGINLDIQWELFYEKVKEVQPSVILLHPYFGFNTIKELVPHFRELRDQGVVIIDDLTQGMFSIDRSSEADFYVGSIRKWLPIPDGAFISVPVTIDKEDNDLVEAKVHCMVEKGKWIREGIGDKELIRKHFAEAEAILDSREEVFRMTSVSSALLSQFDIERMSVTRQKNYTYLEQKIWRNEILSDSLIRVLPNISEGVCPFYFPILVKNGRKELQQYLADNRIYATIIWKCPSVLEGVIDATAQYVYDHILCIPIDQRYAEDDMSRIVEALIVYYSN